MDIDATPEKQTQMFHQLAQSTSDVFWMFSSDWDDLLFVNAAYEQVWGRSRTALETDPTDFLDGIHPDDRPTVEAAMERLSDGDSVELEFRVNAQEDYQRWVRTQGDPVVDETGDVIRVVGVTRDITEQKATRADLTRYKTLIESIPDGIYLFDTDGDLAYVNQAVVEAAQFTREEILGASGEELLDQTLVDNETSVEDVIASNDRVLAGEQDEVRHTLRLESKDGPKPFHIRTTRGVTDDGEEIGLVSIVRDITDRIEIEQELQRQNERLDEFASRVSHDLRNPLNVAQGRLELAQRDCESEHLDIVENAHDRMGALIDDLLLLARHGEPISEVEPVNLAAVVTECWSNVETAETTIHGDIETTVRADRSRLQQLFENLFRNATEHAGADVTIQVGRLTDRYGIYIADDGPGIPDGDREDIFESGYSTGDGTGFGLAIVEEIVEAHGWEISVTNGSDGGARFEITGMEFVE